MAGPLRCGCELGNAACLALGSRWGHTRIVLAYENLMHSDKLPLVCGDIPKLLGAHRTLA